MFSENEQGWVNANEIRGKTTKSAESVIKKEVTRPKLKHSIALVDLEKDENPNALSHGALPTPTFYQHIHNFMAVVPNNSQKKETHLKALEDDAVTDEDSVTPSQEEQVNDLRLYHCLIYVAHNPHLHAIGSTGSFFIQLFKRRRYQRLRLRVQSPIL